MSIGQRLLELRKKRQLSQEEVADKLNVSRQTISKWETDQSTPDFDKITPLCELYGITADELLTGRKENTKQNLKERKEDNAGKKALGIGISIFIYFLSIIWIMISVTVLKMNPIVGTAGFLFICGIATFIIVYTCIKYKSPKKESKKEKLANQINDIIAMFVVVVYLAISFITMAWHITWLIWVVYGIVSEIIKLILMLGGDNDEE